MSKNLVDVLRALDPANDDHWTADGLPRLDVVNEAMGEVVTRKTVTDALPGFNRKNAATVGQPGEVAGPSPDARGASPAGETDPADPEAGDEEEADPDLAAAQAEEEAARQALADAEAAANEAQRKLAEAQKAVDKIVEANEAANRDPHKVTHDIRDFLDQQAYQREMRAKAREIALKGLDPSLLVAKSPLDLAMARKNKRGNQRPAFTPAGG